MNIFQVRKQANRAARRRVPLQHRIEALAQLPQTPLIEALRAQAIHKYNRYGRALAAAKRWTGMFNASAGAKPYRCSLPKKKQRELGMLPPVGTQYAEAA